MKKTEDLKAELVLVSAKTKAEIVAFAESLIADYNALLALDANAALAEKVNAVETLNAALSEKVNEVETLKADLEIAKEVAQSAVEKFNTVAQKAPKANSIKIGGKVHKINYGVNFNGVNYTADELASNEEVVKELIEMGSGAIELTKEGK